MYLLNICVNCSFFTHFLCYVSLFSSSEIQTLENICIYLSKVKVNSDIVHVQILWVFSVNPIKKFLLLLRLRSFSQIYFSIIYILRSTEAAQDCSFPAFILWSLLSKLYVLINSKKLSNSLPKVLFLTSDFVEVFVTWLH